MIFRVTHITEVRYDAMVSLARFNLRLKPAYWHGQSLIDYHLHVSPPPAHIHTEEGAFIVNISRLTLNQPITHLMIESHFTVEVKQPLPLVPQDSPPIADIRRTALSQRSMSKLEPASYLFASKIATMEDDIGNWAAPYLQDNATIGNAAMALMQAIHNAFTYDNKATKTDTLPIEAFRSRHGVCQDFAHIMIIALRSHGIAAAYVSGYLRTLPPPGQPRLIGADATHAWVNIWCGERLGWIGFDPTNNKLAGEDHIFTAMGRDYADVAPVDGVFIGRSGQRLRVSVDVAPTEE